MRPKGDLESKMSSRSLSGIGETQAEPNRLTAKPGPQRSDPSRTKFPLHPHGGLDSDGHRGAIVQCGTFHRIPLKQRYPACDPKASWDMCVGANTASQHPQLGYPDLDAARYIIESGIRHFNLRLPTRHFFGDRQASQTLLYIGNPDDKLCIGQSNKNQLVGVAGHTCNLCAQEAKANLSYTVSFKPPWTPA